MGTNLECSFKKEFLKSTTVLYIENDDSVRTQTSEIFDGFFERVISTSNGEALEKFIQYSEQVDVILMDIDSPEVDSFELLKNIREVNWDVPVLVSTAFEKPEVLLKFIKLNITNYIAKPMQLNTTFKIISLLREEQKRKEDIKRHEYELKQLMAILDSINLVCEIDLDGYITYANDLYLMTSEYSLDELCQMSHPIITPNKTDIEKVDEIRELIFKGKVWSGERSKMTKSGKTYYTFSIIIPIFCNKGKIQKYIEFASPTTKYKNEILKLKKHIISMKTSSFKNDQCNKNIKLEYEVLARKYQEKEEGLSQLVQEYQKRIDDGVDCAQQTLMELDMSKKRIAELEQKLQEQEKRFEVFQAHNMKEFKSNRKRVSMR
jgi:PAS domain S-box-containing protein